MPVTFRPATRTPTDPIVNERFQLIRVAVSFQSKTSIPGTNKSAIPHTATRVVSNTLIQVPKIQQSSIAPITIIVFHSLLFNFPCSSSFDFSSSIASVLIFSGLNTSVSQNPNIIIETIARGAINRIHCAKLILIPAFSLSNCMIKTFPGVPAGVIKPPIPAQQGIPIIRHFARPDSPGLHLLACINARPRFI